MTSHDEFRAETLDRLARLMDQIRTGELSPVSYTDATEFREITSFQDEPVTLYHGNRQFILRLSDAEIDHTEVPT
tara:strand:+ start:352 stop:576 length:225 start_codon:yes stop_codon:yes gene_type:complete